jgi:predicted RNA-binding Zn ribbon-like protein
MNFETDRPPGNLARVADFVNTKVFEEDRIATTGALEQWLVAHNWLTAGAAVSEPDLRAALGLREGIRALLIANSGEGMPAGGMESLNAIASGLPLRLRLDNSGRFSLGSTVMGVPLVLATLLSYVYDAMIDGTWSRLKACRNQACRWAIYDHSKNRSRAWCEMAVCGNRSKVRTYQQRRRASSGKAAASGNDTTDLDRR